MAEVSFGSVFTDPITEKDLRVVVGIVIRSRLRQ